MCWGTRKKRKKNREKELEEENAKLKKRLAGQDNIEASPERCSTPEPPYIQRQHDMATSSPQGTDNWRGGSLGTTAAPMLEAALQPGSQVEALYEGEWAPARIVTIAMHLGVASVVWNGYEALPPLQVPLFQVRPSQVNPPPPPSSRPLPTVGDAPPVFHNGRPLPPSQPPQGPNQALVRDMTALMEPVRSGPPKRVHPTASSSSRAVHKPRPQVLSADEFEEDFKTRADAAVAHTLRKVQFMTNMAKAEFERHVVQKVLDKEMKTAKKDGRKPVYVEEMVKKYAQKYVEQVRKDRNSMKKAKML